MRVKYKLRTKKLSEHMWRPLAFAGLRASAWPKDSTSSPVAAAPASPENSAKTVSPNSPYFEIYLECNRTNQDTIMSRYG